MRGDPAIREGRRSVAAAVATVARAARLAAAARVVGALVVAGVDELAELVGGVAGGVDPLFLLLEQAVSASAPTVPATSTSCLIMIVLLAVRHGRADGSVQIGTSA